MKSVFPLLLALSAFATPSLAQEDLDAQRQRVAIAYGTQAAGAFYLGIGCYRYEEEFDLLRVKENAARYVTAPYVTAAYKAFIAESRRFMPVVKQACDSKYAEDAAFNTRDTLSRLRQLRQF